MKMCLMAAVADVFNLKGNVEYGRSKKDRRGKKYV